MGKHVYVLIPILNRTRRLKKYALLLNLKPTWQTPMKKLQFRIEINAPLETVYHVMLGIDTPATYEAWTAAFNPSSTYEGNWEKGSRMLFVGTDEKGEKGGMVSEIVENIPNQFVSIKHRGMLVAGKEVTEGPDVEKWAGGLENYSFQAHSNHTLLIVDLDTAEDFADYMNATYPLALEKLKEIAEKTQP